MEKGFSYGDGWMSKKRFNLHMTLIQYETVRELARKKNLTMNDYIKRHGVPEIRPAREVSE